MASLASLVNEFSVLCVVPALVVVEYRCSDFADNA